MNKQEAIKKVEQMGEYERFVNESIPKLSVLNILNQLDEPKEKVTLPRPVANWISCVRGRNKTLHFALENAPEEVNLWFCEDEKNRQNIFADAWVNGYHIEKEKRYLVKIIGITDYNSYLNYHKENNRWTIESSMDTDTIRTKHTRKELKAGGFCEVFNSPLFEVEEVAE